jgi:hypothetical protein
MTIMIIQIFFHLIPLIMLSEGAKEEKYSSFRCIGGSQVFETASMVQATYKKFPLNDPEHRTCYFRNVCVIGGDITYFISDNKKSSSENVMNDFLPSGFDGNMYHTGHLRGFTSPIKTIVGSIPHEYPFHHSNITFFDSNSWTFNYGHYLIDNVIPAFTAAMVFNIPFEGTQQVIESNCRHFSVLEVAFSERIVTYNHSMGTYRQGCLEKLDGMWSHFFDSPPLYADLMKESGKNLCFRRFIAGQGSTFGLKSLDLTRAVVLRKFRDFVLHRIDTHLGLKPPIQEDMILVGLRTTGSAGGELIKDLCSRVREEMQKLPAYVDKYKVVCIHPSNLGFEDEIFHAQRAKVIVSVHGTISYMTLFARDGTQQISIANPTELKENQILLWATHFNTYYLTWDRLPNLSQMLAHAIEQAETFHGTGDGY